MDFGLERLWIGLGEWILADGNYRDFRAGQEARFALEFHPRRFTQAADCIPFLQYLHKCLYQFCAPVVYHLDSPIRATSKAGGEKRERTENICVLDLGFLTYYEDDDNYVLPPEAKTGTWWSGELSLGVDPYFYFEYLHRRPGIPPLIYPWRIERIIADRTPYVPKFSEEVGHYMGRDETRGSSVEVWVTDVWDKEARAYLLECTRLGEPTEARFLPPSPEELSASQALVGTEVELRLMEPAEYVAEHGSGPYPAEVIDLSPHEPWNQSALLRLQAPIFYQGNRCHVAVAWPRFDGEGVGRLATGGEFFAYLKPLPEDEAIAAAPFESRNWPMGLPLRAKLRRL